MQIITKYKAPQWENALKNVKGIYAITDISNGKIYIGSAIGENGIWQRWCSYAKEGTEKMLGVKGTNEVYGIQMKDGAFNKQTKCIREDQLIE